MLSGLLLHAPEFELFAGLLEAGLLLGCLPMIDLLIYDNVSEVSRYLGQGSTLTATSPLLSRIYLVTSEPSELVIQKVERRSNRSLLDGGKGRRCYVWREESNAGLGTFFFFFFATTRNRSSYQDTSRLALENDTITENRQHTDFQCYRVAMMIASAMLSLAVPSI
jgi:hypothetical protein